MCYSLYMVYLLRHVLGHAPGDGLEAALAGGVRTHARQTLVTGHADDVDDRAGDLGRNQLLADRLAREECTLVQKSVNIWMK